MEELTEQENNLIIDAVNNYFHLALNELAKKNLGDIERKNWEYIKNNCKILIDKLY